MSIKFGFLQYISIENTQNVIKFNETFKEYLNVIPSGPCSSKKIYNIFKNLNVSDIDLLLFQNVYLEFFKYKLIK